MGGASKDRRAAPPVNVVCGNASVVKSRGDPRVCTLYNTRARESFSTGGAIHVQRFGVRLRERHCACASLVAEVQSIVSDILCIFFVCHAVGRLGTRAVNMT